MKMYIAILTMVTMFTFSCGPNYLFENPQPIDAKNMDKFPVKFRGTYLMDGATWVIGNDFVRNTDLDRVKIINGIYVNPADTIGWNSTNGWSNHFKVNKHFESLQTIMFDSLNKPIDTVNNYLTKGSKIYRVDSSGGLVPGFPFTIKNDTIISEMKREIYLRLGDNAVLRKVSDNLYALNFTTMEDLTDRAWWVLIFLEPRPDGKILLRDFSPKIRTMNEEIYLNKSTHYYDPQWTRKDLIKLIGEDSAELIPVKK